ncbi:MAG: hypothetical protein IKS12_01360, partial [Eubacterium sp.]|nr:hypothetical protein [Eubacterium sp.]
MEPRVSALISGRFLLLFNLFPSPLGEGVCLGQTDEGKTFGGIIMKIKLKDGSILEYSEAKTAADIC